MDTQKEIEGLIIRNLKKEDIRQIVRIDALAVGYPRNVYFERKFTRTFGQDSQLLLNLVAEVHNKVIGFIMGEANTGEYGISEPVASVDTIAIHPDYKAKGLGKRLLDDFCEMAEKAGIELMTTLVSEDWPEVIDFFETNGFKPVKMIALERKLNPR